MNALPRWTNASTQMDKRFEKVDARFERMEDRFHTLNLAFIGGAAVVIATLLGGILF